MQRALHPLLWLGPDETYCRQVFLAATRRLYIEAWRPSPANPGPLVFAHLQNL
jgi:hypothetical protein